MVSLINIKSTSITNNLNGNKAETGITQSISAVDNTINTNLINQLNSYMKTIITETNIDNGEYLTENLTNFLNILNTNTSFKNTMESAGLSIGIFENILTLIKKSITLTNINQDFESLKEDYSQLQKLYNNINSLLEQVDYLKRQFNVFEDVYTTMTVKPQINEKYLTYINTYGFPENGVFDLALLK